MENEGNASHWPFKSQLAHQHVLLTSHQHILLYEACYPLPSVGISRKKLWAKKGEKTVDLDPLSIRKPGVSLAPCGVRFCFAHGVKLCSVDSTLSPIQFFIVPLSPLPFVGDLSQSCRSKTCQNWEQWTPNQEKMPGNSRGSVWNCFFITFSVFLVNCKFSVDIIWYRCWTSERSFAPVDVNGKKILEISKALSNPALRILGVTAVESWPNLVLFQTVKSVFSIILPVDLMFFVS